MNFRQCLGRERCVRIYMCPNKMWSHSLSLQGMIAGPGEFAEGVARGVKSLLGHVIGNSQVYFPDFTVYLNNQFMEQFSALVLKHVC